jgi:hypothetical protein
LVVLPQERLFALRSPSENGVVSFGPLVIVAFSGEVPNGSHRISELFVFGIRNILRRGLRLKQFVLGTPGPVQARNAHHP